MNPSTESTQLSTLPRRYTLAEIDEMRELIHETLIHQFPYMEDELPTTVEMRLRTYMLAGISVQECRDGLEAAKEKLKEHYRQRHEANNSRLQILDGTPET